MSRKDRALRRSHDAAVRAAGVLKNNLQKEVEAHMFTHVLLSEAREAARNLEKMLGEMRERCDALSDAVEGGQACTAPAVAHVDGQTNTDTGEAVTRVGDHAPDLVHDFMYAGHRTACSPIYMV